MVNKDQVKKTLEELRKISKKRKFSQTVDLIMNFKNLDLKKTTIDHFITLPHAFTKKSKICVIVDDDFVKGNTGKADRVIGKSELEEWKDNKEVKKLGKEFSFFISQANLMGLVATKFGRILGPLGKMPNPRFGAVIPPGADIKDIIIKFRKSIRVICKNEYIVKTKVGYEDMKDEEIIDNVMYVYDTISHSLPHAEHNIKSVILKFTMGKPLVIDKKETKENLLKKASPKKLSKEKASPNKKLLEKKIAKEEKKNE
ncbi:MAG: hypothetical protein KKG75_00005 [Nanoarchaeota archaeon]|nr:hypothetical protein [Nanoarchaeota archaeon]